MFVNHLIDQDFADMPRRRHQKSQTQTTAPTPQKQSREYFPAAQVIAQRMANGGVDYLKQNLIRVMIGSAKLAEEIEFKDLYLDGEKAAQVTNRWLKKYDKRLEAAKKKGLDEYHEVADEMRIEIVAELATPPFRKEVDQRLQTLMDRLMRGKDTKKLEMVMMLTPALRMKSIPWGLCGLILEIYNRTMQRAMQEYEEDRSVFDAVAEALKAEGEEEIDIFTILKHPDKLEQIGKKIFEAQPGLRQRAEKQVWEMVEAFEDALGHGDVELSLFSEEELVLPFQRIQAEFGEPFTQAQPPEEMRERIFEAIRQAITEIMTPERFRRFREEVDKTAINWLRTRQKWGAALQFELGHLGDHYEENKFILVAFIGQIYRLGKEHNPAAKKKKKR
jgi:glycerophosphoryl diester phosphodiesterase